jgi:hypothetical protein
MCLEGLGQPGGVAGGLHGHDGVGADTALEIGGRVQRQDLPVVHDGDAVTEFVGLFHVVGRQQDGLAFRVEAPEEFPQCETALRVKARRGLVEEEHGGTVEDGAGDHEALRHPSGQRIHGRFGEAAELEPLEELVGRLAALPRSHPEQSAVEVQVLPGGQLSVQGVLLGDDADELLDERRVAHDVDPTDERAAGRGNDPGRQHAHGGGLARTVRPEQPEDLAGCDAQVQLVDGAEVGTGIGLDEAVRLDDEVPRTGGRAVERGRCVRRNGHDSVRQYRPRSGQSSARIW